MKRRARDGRRGCRGPQADAKAATKTLTAAEAAQPQPKQTPQPTKLEQDAHVNRPVQTIAERSANHCEVRACASTYASFRMSDCTYQPYDGPRRVCAAAPQQHSAQREHPFDILPSRLRSRYYTTRIEMPW